MRHAFTMLLGITFALWATVGCERDNGGSGAAGGGATTQSSGDRVKIGFLVKQPEEPWFQTEWKFAQQAADEKGFELIKIGATDGEKTLSAIDNLAAQGAKGFVICTPDVRLGPAIKAKADASGLKVLSVDDRFLGPDGKPMEDVHYVGISARNIGKMVGKNLAEQMKARGWTAADTGLCVVTFDELETARERTEGAMEALAEAGFPKAKMFRTPQKTSDVQGAFDAANILLTQHPAVKNWLVCGLNDNTVMGAVRAMEGRNIGPDRVCGIGINGTDALVEFRKDKPTGFYASVLLTARRHGYDTAAMMHEWVTKGVEPPKVTLTEGILITRDTYEKIMKEQGML